MLVPPCVIVTTASLTVGIDAVIAAVLLLIDAVEPLKVIASITLFSPARLMATLLVLLALNVPLLVPFWLIVSVPLPTVGIDAEITAVLLFIVALVPLKVIASMMLFSPSRLIVELPD